ncbi:hypothetical protein Tco_0734056 [Tanacetum coccineum]
MTSRRPDILNRSSTQTIELPTQEDQIRGYRAMTRGIYQAARATRIVFGRNNYNLTLDSAVDPERQLELSRERSSTYPFGDIHDKVTCAASKNQETHHRMSLANQKATTQYHEAIQATEDIESPAVGFAKISDYKGGLTIQVKTVIKQNNTLLYLASKQSQKLIELEEKFDKLKQEVHTITEKEIQSADLEDSISSLAKRLDNFSISGKLPVKRADGKIHVFEDPNKIFKEQFEKEPNK